MVEAGRQTIIWRGWSRNWTKRRQQHCNQKFIVYYAAKPEYRVICFLFSNQNYWILESLLFNKRDKKKVFRCCSVIMKVFFFETFNKLFNILKQWKVQKNISGTGSVMRTINRFFFFFCINQQNNCYHFVRLKVAGVSGFWHKPSDWLQNITQLQCFDTY